MSSEPLDNKLERIEKKLGRLLTAYNTVRKELEKLKQENEKLRKDLLEKNEKLERFQYEIKISKIANYLVVNTEDEKELVAKIDEYVKEIDSCIAFLNRQL